MNFECQNANTVTRHSCSHGLTHTRSPVLMLRTFRQTPFSRDSTKQEAAARPMHRTAALLFWERRVPTLWGDCGTKVL